MLDSRLVYQRLFENGCERLDLDLDRVLLNNIDELFTRFTVNTLKADLPLYLPVREWESNWYLFIASY